MSVGGVKKKNGHLMLTYNDIKSLHLEPTQSCQAMCPMCDRVTPHGHLNPQLKNKSLSIYDIKKLFDKKFISQLDEMYMCGNVGDPMLAPDCDKIFQYFRDNNPNIMLSMNTNGGAKKSDWWARLASVVDYITFSIDGLEDTNHIYRKGVKWSNVMTNVSAYIEAGGYAKWDFLVFEHNEHQIEEAKHLSEEMGFKEFILKGTGRYGFGSTSYESYLRGNKSDILSQPKNESYQSELVTNRKGYEEKRDYDINPKCVKQKKIYVDAEGNIWPCCWAHGSFITYHNINTDEKLDIIDHCSYYDINGLKHGLQNVIENGWFKSFQDRWKGDDKPYICMQKCSSLQEGYNLQILEETNAGINTTS